MTADADGSPNLASPFGTERQPVVREDVLHVGVKPHGTDKLFDCSNTGASSTFSRGRAAFRSVSHTLKHH